MVGKNKLGLIIGFFVSLMHLIWLITLAIMPNLMQRYLDWIISLHGLNPIYVINPAYVTWLNGLILVVLTFVAGYIF